MATKDKAVEFLTETGAEKVQVDVVGIGKGVVDQGKAEGKPFEGINVGEHAEDKKRFLNLRAEIYWAVRELFEKGNIDIDADDEDLAAELASIRYFRTAGKIQIESKRQAKDRGVPSPNRAEALVLASAKARKKLTKATWGKRRTIH
jgi:phage terminase large subunit